jgi:NDP-sugar pyrophosphorylase family protein
MLTPNKMAVSEMLPWMNGTTVELRSDRSVTSFRLQKDISSGCQYKTVNIYSLCSESWKRTTAELGRSIANGHVNEYYESVFAKMVAKRTLNFEAVLFEENSWYEIDTPMDLSNAEILLSRTLARESNRAGSRAMLAG